MSIVSGEKNWEASLTSPGIPPVGSSVYNCRCSDCRDFRSTIKSCPIVVKPDYCSADKGFVVGDRVLVDGIWTGVVRYFGNLDGSYGMNKTFVGIKLDDPVGEHDGIFDGKRYFRCPSKHGVMVSRRRVSLLVMDKKRKQHGTKCSLSALSQVPTLPPLSKKSLTALDRPAAEPQPPKTGGSPHPETVKSRLTKIATPQTSKTAGNQHPMTVGPQTTTIAKPQPPKVTRSQPANAYRSKPTKTTKSQPTKGCKSQPIETVVPQPPKTPKPAHTRSVRQFVPSKPALVPIPSSKLFSELLCSECCKARSCILSSSASNRKLSHSRFSMPADMQNSLKNELGSSPSRKSMASSKGSPTNNVLMSRQQTVLLPNRMSLSCRPAPLTRSPSQRGPIAPNPSFTGRLLSAMPPENQTTPTSGNTHLRDIDQFSQWLDAWGGGPRAWTMACTLQKLKDAQRRGAKEVQWQKTLDDLELCKEYLPQIQRIKALRKEIDAVRENREEIEKQTRVIVKMKSMVKTQVKFFQEKFLKEKLRCGVLESEIQKHPFVETLISH